MLIEYSKAQDSAEHHNQMIWIVTPTFLGFVFYILVNYQTLDVPFKPLLFLVAGCALTYLSFLVEGAYRKKQFKYDICVEIEKELRLKGQHRRMHQSGTGQRISRAIRLTLFLVLLGANVFVIWHHVDEPTLIAGSVSLASVSVMTVVEGRKSLTQLVENC